MKAMRTPESVGLTDCPSTTNLFNNVECCCGSGCCWDQCPKTLDVIATDFPDCLSEVANSSWIYNEDRARYEAYQAYIGTYVNAICDIFTQPPIPGGRDNLPPKVAIFASSNYSSLLSLSSLYRYINATYLLSSHSKLFVIPNYLSFQICDMFTQPPIPRG